MSLKRKRSEHVDERKQRKQQNYGYVLLLKFFFSFIDYRFCWRLMLFEAHLGFISIADAVILMFSLSQKKSGGLRFYFLLRRMFQDECLFHKTNEELKSFESHAKFRV